MLTKPDFTLPSPNPRKSNTTDAAWWLRCHLLALESTTRDGGTYANKSGFHGFGKDQVDKGQGNSGTNYSIRDGVNRTGPLWKTMSSAFDWTFTTAQRGDYALIDRYTSRLMQAAVDPADTRLDLGLFEFYGQADSDKQVEGYDELHEKNVTSDDSHLWHLHLSFLRNKCGDFWAMWAIYTVLIGWTYRQWLASLPQEEKPNPPVNPVPPNSPAALPNYRLGSRVLRYTPGNLMRGTDVKQIQLFIGPKQMGKADGIAGPKFKSGVLWYQKMRGIKPYDGIAGPKTLAPILRVL